MHLQNIISINSNTIIQRHSDLLSIVIHLGSTTYLHQLASAVIDKLVSSPISSFNGIHVTIESPYSSHGLLNVYRPAVLRQYFGINYKKEYPYVQRYSYGTGVGVNSVGIDPSNLMTRELTNEMKDLSMELYNMLHHSRNKLNMDSVDLSVPFNHCTILLYYCSNDLKRESVINHHCDCTFSVHNGNYVPSANSQVQNTPTIIYSLGGSRN